MCACMYVCMYVINMYVCMYVCMHVYGCLLYTIVVNFPLYAVRACATTLYGFNSLLMYVRKVSDGTALSNTVYIEVKSTRYSDRRLFQLSLWQV